ncbi:MAG: type II toxin-antitoxin system death-on-curing family toxin, partial [Thermomicrobiales bacterium]
EHDPASRASLLGRLQFELTRPVDFTRTDPEATAAKVRLLTAAAVYFNLLAVTEFGGRSGPVRQQGLVEQIVAAAFQSYGGEEPHPSPFAKAAMLMRGITQGHPFTDANKRTGFLVALYYLDRVGFVLRPDLPTAQIVSFSRRVSAGEVRDSSTIASMLQGWTEPRRQTRQET